MGRDKAKMVLGGMTLLERAVEALRPICGEVWVVGREGKDRGLRYIPDELPGLGPIGGLYTGLRALGRGRAIFTACDMPFLEPEVIEMLLGYGSEAVVFRYEGTVHPLPGVYDALLVGRIESQMSLGERSLRALLTASRTTYVPLPPYLARSLLDLDSPEDLRVVHRASDRPGRIMLRQQEEGR